MSKHRTSITIDERVRKKIEQCAERENRNFSNMIEVMVIKYDPKKS